MPSAAAEQQRPVVRTEGRRSPPAANRASGRSVRASRMTVGPPSTLVTMRAPSRMKIGITDSDRWLT